MSAATALKNFKTWFIKQTRNKKGEIIRLACGIIRHGLPADSVDHSEILLLSLYLVQPVPISPNNMDQMAVPYHWELKINDC